MVDLACMRDAMNKLGSDSNKINPLVCVVLIICPCTIIDVTDMGHSDIIFGLQVSCFDLVAYGCMLTLNKILCLYFASYTDSSKTIKCLYSNHILLWVISYLSKFFFLDSLTHGDDKKVLYSIARRDM